MARVMIVFLSCCLVVPSALAEDPVHFSDVKLKAAVENALWVTDPTPTDMLDLTGLICIECGITSLTGLEYADNLQMLNLRLNDFSNLSPVSGLTNLTTLRLTINGIRSISPLSGLTNLRTLDLHGNEISDLSPLSGLGNLRTLVVHRNKISNLSPLSGLDNLKHLDIQRNQVTSISALSGLDNLDTLLLEYNRISSVSALSSLTSLKRLDLRQNPLNQEAYDTYLPLIEANNPGIDLKYTPCIFHQVAISSAAGGSVTDPGEGRFTYGDGECVRLQAEADPCFVFVRWAGSYSAAENPAALAVDQDYEIQARFQSALETIYVDDNAPNDPGPGDATRSDPQENGTPEHPFDEIQEAIELAGEGARIIVRAGTYYENIDLLGKSIELTGLDPNDPNEPTFPVIDGGSTGTVLSFTHGEDPNCIVLGFVLTRGQGQSGGAVLCSGSSPTIANCLIVGNRTTDPDGAAVYCIDSQAAFVNCTIADNGGDAQGTALCLVGSNVTVVDSILWGNGTNEIFLSEANELGIIYTDVAGGWPGLGNTDVDPLFAQRGYWIDPDNPGIVLNPSEETAVWIAGDYHLRSQGGRWDPQTRDWVADEVTSPCIDTGDPLEAIGQEPVPNGGVINMGAYGGTTEAGKTY